MIAACLGGLPQVVPDRHRLAVLGELWTSVASAGILLPTELMRAQQYNTTIHLTWSHYLTQRGRAVPTTFEAESSVRLRMLRSTQCLIMHAEGLNFTEVRRACA